MDLTKSQVFLTLDIKVSNLSLIAGLPFDEAICKSEKSIEDAEIQVTNLNSFDLIFNN